MKIINNVFQSILLFITVSVSIISFTLLNKNFVIHTFEVNNYYEKLYKEGSQEQKFDDFKKSTNKYIKSRYKKEYELNSFSKFTNKYNIKKYAFIIYFINILLIIITGSILMKNKEKHNLKFILLLSAFMCICYYGVIFISFNVANDIISGIITKYNYFNLIFGIIIYDYYFVKYFLSKCK